VLVAVIAWLGVVIAGSTMTWATINTAGQEVLSPGSVPTPRTDSALPPVRDPATVRPSPEASESLGSPAPRRRTPTPSASPDDESSRSPDAPDDAPSRSPAPSRTAEPAPAPSSPDAGPRAFTWRGAAGSVTVLCEASSISLQAASPANGYSVEVRERGPEDVDVRLESEDEETDVEVECAGGRAVFDISS
jgi:hypothetical protein